MLVIFLAKVTLGCVNMVIVNVHEAKTNLSRLLKQVEEGQEVIIARNGKPVARLVGEKIRGKRRPGTLKGNRVWEELSDLVMQPLPEEELAMWEGRK